MNRWQNGERISLYQIKITILTMTEPLLQKLPLLPLLLLLLVVQLQQLLLLLLIFLLCCYLKMSTTTTTTTAAAAITNNNNNNNKTEMMIMIMITIRINCTVKPNCFCQMCSLFYLRFIISRLFIKYSPFPSFYQRK